MYEDYTYYITKGFMDRASKWIIREYSLATCEKANVVISPSYKTLNYLRKIGVSKYIGVIPTGIDTTRFINYQVDENRKKEFLEQHGIPSDAKIMLSLGRVAKEKGIDELLDRFNDLCKIRNDTYFVIVGNGPDIDHFKKRAIELGIADRTKFIGAVPYSDIDFYYSIGHVFVNASVSETQGLTYLEAMASKKIILAKFDSNLTELIVDGQNGFFFEKKEEFLQKICQIFDNYDTYYSVMVKNMIESVDKLSLKNFYTNIMEVYEKAKRNNI
jgi:1,2-diacylglycerol 3-alpha-glucosyltransferase